MKTLYRQFIATTVLIIVFSTIASYLLTNMYYNLVAKEMYDEQNLGIAQEISRYIEATPDLNLEQYLLTLGEIGYQLYVTSESGYSKFIGKEFSGKELSESIKRSVYDGHAYHGMRQFSRQSFMSGMFVNELENTVGYPFIYENEAYGLFLRPNINLLVTEVHIIVAGWVVSTAIICLLAMLVVAKRLIRPISQLTEATKRISQEKYDHLLEIKRQDEIGQLAMSFNEMTVQLQENDRSRKEFISNVSHDFQSPLLNIQGYADLLKSESISEEERVTFTSIIEQEAKRLSILTKQLLLLSSLEQSTGIVKPSYFSLDQQLKSLSHKYLWRIEEMGLELYYRMSPVQFHGDESLLETLWDNLFTNALKYNIPNGSIRIELEKFDKHITILFEDTGIGLSEEELPHVFERFYRADRSRTKEGTGLGLTIAKQIVELHQGSIEVSSRLGEGTRFLISLPKL